MGKHSYFRIVSFQVEDAWRICSLKEKLKNFKEFIWGAIHSTKISGNFGPKLNGSVRSNRKSFEKTGPPFEVVHFSRSDRLEYFGWMDRAHGFGGRCHKIRDVCMDL